MTWYQYISLLEKTGKFKTITRKKSPENRVEGQSDFSTRTLKKAGQNAAIKKSIGREV